MAASVYDNTLRILQDRLEKRVTTHRATMAPDSSRYYDESKLDNKGSTEDEPCSEGNAEETHPNDKDLHVVDRIVRHFASGPCLKYVIRWYGYSEAEDNAEPRQHIPQNFFDAYWR